MIERKKAYFQLIYQANLGLFKPLSINKKSFVYDLNKIRLVLKVQVKHVESFNDLTKESLLSCLSS